jgi:hypothetical protein
LIISCGEKAAKASEASHEGKAAPHFGVQYQNEMHVYCEEDQPGWQLTYFGRLKAFDEALTIIGQAEVLRPA